MPWLADPDRGDLVNVAHAVRLDPDLPLPAAGGKFENHYAGLLGPVARSDPKRRHFGTLWPRTSTAPRPSDGASGSGVIFLTSMVARTKWTHRCPLSRLGDALDATRP